MEPRTRHARSLLFLFAGLAATGCEPVVCGDATMNIDGRCVPAATACGAGSQFDATAGQCIGDAAAIQCGPGTRLESMACVPTAGGVTCAAGTVVSMGGDSCVVAPAACGSGTQFDTATRTCVAGNVSCGPGTAELNGQCLPTMDVCGPGTVFAPELARCVRGEAYVGDCATPMVIDGPRIDGEVVLAAGGCFEVPTELTVQGTLRIEPGVTVIFHEGARLFVTGVLSAVGTAMSPILLRGETSAPGAWDGVMFSDSDQLDNALRYVEITDAGGEVYRGRQGGLVLQGNATRVALSNLTLRDNAAYGLDTDVVTLEAFDTITITGSELAPIRMPADAIGQLTSAATLTGNGRDEVEIRGGASEGGRLLRDATWPKLDVPYHLTGNLDVEARLELGPDLHIRVAENVEWFVRPQGTLRAIAPQETVIEGDMDRRGHWSGLVFDGSDRIDNALQRVEVVHGGGIEYRGQRGNIAISDWSGPARLAIQETISRRSAGYGLAAATQVTLDFSQVTLTENTLGAAHVSPEVALQLDDQSSYSANDVDRVVVVDRPGTNPLRVGGELAAINVPYQLGDLFVVAPLAIAPGTDLRFREGAELFILQSGSLAAPGTMNDPIIFAGEVATPGYWDGIRFESSDHVANRLEHVVIAHGGRAAYRGLQANLVIRGRPDPVRLWIADLLLESGSNAGVAIEPNLVMPSCARVSFLGVVPEVIASGVSSGTLCSN
ncbi:MAG: hypothetical protein RIT81_20745 [Deltaproteobacteria bacterium]